MQIQFFIKVVGSLFLVLVLALTIILTNPQLSSSQILTKNKSLETLEQGIRFDYEGNVADAEFFYEEAIDQVLSNKDVEILIVAKMRLADLREKRGLKDEAERLRKEADAGEIALGADTKIGGNCGDCKTGTGVLGRMILQGTPLARCVQCIRDGFD